MNLSINNLKSNQKLMTKIELFLGLFLFFGAIIIYLNFAIKANSDLSEGKHVLFMDEQIIFNGVNQILNSEDTSKFIENISTEGDHRWGKILYNVNALASSIPKSVWGEQGQIIATRMLQTLRLLGVYILLSLTFLKSWLNRSLLLISLLLLTGTSYYFTMPKPEPLQILFIALFLYFANKKDFKFGKHWIFMGLALGTKISALPIVLFYLMLSIYQDRHLFKEGATLLRTTMNSVVAFLIGVILAEPMIVFGNWQTYLDSTWRNTSHGLDDSTVNVMSWFKLIIDDGPTIILILAALGALCCIYLLAVRIKNIITQKKWIDSIHFNDKKHLIVVLGFLLLFFYMLTVDRLWNFYLIIPFVFIIIGTFVFIEKAVHTIKPTHQNLKIDIITVLLVITFYFIGSGIKADNKTYNNFASRTKNENYILKSTEYTYIDKTLKSISSKSNKKLSVYYDPQLFQLSPNDSYKPEPFWGYFLYWDKQYDVIVYYSNHGENLKADNLPETNISYENWKKAMLLFEQFTIQGSNNIVKDTTSSNNLKLYKKLDDDKMPNRLNIFIKSDLYNNYKIK